MKFLDLWQLDAVLQKLSSCYLTSSDSPQFDPFFKNEEFSLENGKLTLEIIGHFEFCDRVWLLLMSNPHMYVSLNLTVLLGK